MKGVTLIDASEKVVSERLIDKPFHMAIHLVYIKRKGVGDIITGCTEESEIVPGVDVRFYPSGVKLTPFSGEMHHENVSKTVCGDNVDVNVKSLAKGKMQRVGDEICTEDPESDPNPSKSYEKFAALLIVQNHAEQLKCSQHDTKSDGYKDVYLCRIWISTGNVMFGKIEPFWTLLGAVAVYVLFKQMKQMMTSDHCKCNLINI